MTSIEDLLAMDAYDFEHLVKSVLEYKGYANAEVTKQSGDGGIDIRATYQTDVADFPVVAEVKRWRNKVDIDRIQRLKGAIADDGRNAKGLFVTTSSFTAPAKTSAGKPDSKIELIDGPKLAAIINEMESRKTKLFQETDADLRAVDNIAVIYDEIKKQNKISTDRERHGLNTFMARVIFCMYAQSTAIFKERAFSNYIAAAEDKNRQWGREFSVYLNEMFEILNTERKQRPVGLERELQELPYVNGNLFGSDYAVFDIPSEARTQMLKCCALNWQEINPDIFGSMFQAVVSSEQRSNMGQHYTSVDNIKKVIEPLFMDSLNRDFENCKWDADGLKVLLDRLGNLRVFDPACGSGNFLIIAYKMLRELEIRILDRLKYLKDRSIMLCSRIEIEQFRGIELDDFAHEIAVLSLWLAEHQMNVMFEDVLGQRVDNLPLKRGKNTIVQGNALRIDWETVCPKDGAEIYIAGNPPFLGIKTGKWTQEQAEDKDNVFAGCTDYRNLDYVTCWFKKASDFIKGTKTKFAFVSTNSICQGTQAPMLWDKIFAAGQAIEFAYQSFKWTNNAKKNAGVSVIIVGVSNNDSIGKRRLFSENGDSMEMQSISALLKDGARPVVRKRPSKPLSRMPEMIQGNLLLDNGNLIISAEEFTTVENEIPEALPFIKKYINASDFIKGNDSRYCLWITENTKDDALEIPFIKEKVEACRNYRAPNLKKRKDLRENAERPWEYFQVRFKGTSGLFIPRTTTKSRKFIPVVLIDNETIVSDSCQFIHNASLFEFGIMSSCIHMLWAAETSGGMGDKSVGYSSSMTYNTFPFPEITNEQKQNIETAATEVLNARENHKNRTIAWLYDPDTMPDDLAVAHAKLDKAVERCFRAKPFKDDRERIDFLYESYAKMVAAEGQQ